MALFICHWGAHFLSTICYIFILPKTDTLSDVVCRQYDEAKTYHDGKWVMFEPTNADEFDDYMKLLAIKRKPNRK